MKEELRFINIDDILNNCLALNTVVLIVLQLTQNILKYLILVI